MNETERVATANGAIAVLESSEFRTRPWLLAGERGAETTSSSIFGVEFSSGPSGDISATVNRHFACVQLKECDEFPRGYLFTDRKVVPSRAYLAGKVTSEPIQGFQALWRRSVSGQELIILSPPGDQSKAHACFAHFIKAGELAVARPTFWAILRNSRETGSGVGPCEERTLFSLSMNDLGKPPYDVGAGRPNVFLEISDVLFTQGDLKLLVGTRKDETTDIDSTYYVDVNKKSALLLPQRKSEEREPVIEQPVTFFGSGADKVLQRITFSPEGDDLTFDLELLQLTDLKISRQRLALSPESGVRTANN